MRKELKSIYLTTPTRDILLAERGTITCIPYDQPQPPCVKMGTKPLECLSQVPRTWQLHFEGEPSRDFHNAKTQDLVEWSTKCYGIPTYNLLLRFTLVGGVLMAVSGMDAQSNFEDVKSGKAEKLDLWFAFTGAKNPLEEH